MVEFAYSRIQKILSGILMFLIVFTQTFHVVWFQGVSAYASDYRDIVSIFVDKNTYDEFSSQIRGYARNIQSYLGSTRVVIFPVEESISPFAIASLNEKLYYEGDGDGLSRLVGTILIGSVPLPVVHRDGKTFVSIFPYTDFTDKSFLYNTEKKYYEYSNQYRETSDADIWHGVIAPNTGTKSTNSTALQNFFNKSEDFYSKSGKYADTNTLEDPYVFYYDGYHEQLATKLNGWKSYELYMKHQEDISYKRWNKDLANQITKEQGNVGTDEMGDMVDGIVSQLEQTASGSDQLESALEIQDAFNSGGLAEKQENQMNNVPDIKSKEIIQNLAKPFHEIINSQTIGTELKNVHNAGRYTSGTTVRADIVPLMVTKQDEIMNRILKDANGVLESFTDNLVVTGGLSRKIPVLTQIQFDRQEFTHWLYGYQPIDPPFVELKTTSNYQGNNIANYQGYYIGADHTGSYIYKNYFFGKEGSDIISTTGCTILRGSSRLVEANRSYNTLLALSDVTLLQDDTRALAGVNGIRDACFQANSNSADIRTMTYWGGNTPLNIDNAKTAETGYMELGNHAYDSFVRPILDIAGMRQVDSGSILRDSYQNSPVRCLAHDDLILQPRVKQVCNNWFWDSGCTPPYGSVADNSWNEWNKNGRLVVNQDDVRFTCSSTVNKKTSNSFEEYYQSLPTATCTVGNLRLDNSLVLSGSNPCVQYIYSGSENGGYQIISTFDPVTKKPITPMDPLLGIFYDYYRLDDSRYLTIDYKSIQSAMFHKSPTDEELSIAEATQMTPGLAIDRDRYVSFISAAGNEQKIIYPNLFRIELTDNEIVDTEKARLAIKKFLDESSAEVNALIASETPPTSGIAKDIYNLFKNGSYPIQNIDYYAVLEKDSQVLKTVIQNVIWNNLKNATAKYSFIFEHYIDEKGKDKTLLPLHRTDYEISYMGGLGNAQGMRVLLDPEGTEEAIPPYIADIMKAYDTGINAIDAANVTEDNYNDNGNKTDDKCGSPDGVNIFFEWFPAIICWIQTLLPPKILAGSCTPSTIGQDSNRDNANRIIPPTITGTGYQTLIADFFNGGIMKVIFDKNTINTNDTIAITSFFETSSGSVVDFDNTYDVVGSITKIEAYKEDGSFGVVYQSGMDESILRKYISTESVLTSGFTNGEAKFYIGSRSEDANITFQTAVRRYDPEGNPLLDVTSNPTIFKIRAGNINVTVQSGSEVVSSVSVQSNPSLSLVFDAVSSSGSRKESVFPYTYSFIDDVSEEVIATGTVNEDIVPFPTSIFSRIGVYKIEVQDGRGVYGVSSFSVNPGDLHEIRAAASSNYLVQGENTPVVLQLIDAYGNLTSGELYDLEISVSNGYINDGGGEKETITRSVLDGALIIDVGTKNSGSVTVNVREKNTGKSGQTVIQSIPYAKGKITLGGTPIAGGTGVTVAITVVDQNNQKIAGFNGVALLDFPESSGLFSGSTVQIVNGEASTLFLPGTVASNGIQPQIQIPGIRNIEVSSIAIEPNDPMYIEMRTTGNEAFEAKQGNTYEVIASLRDRYGNKVISPRNNIQVSFIIPDDYARYIRFENGSTGQVVSLGASGTARANVISTGIPGTSYILGEVTPGLTSDIVISDGGKASIISALSNAVIRLQTYYVFNKEKVDRIDYNSLYTVLLGAPYGDITTEQYLGGELLFGDGSRGLGITTLSDDPYIRETIGSFHPQGAFKGKLNTSPEISMTTHTEITNDGLSVVFYDETYKENIARITPRFLSAPKMISCGFASGTITDDCVLPDTSHIAIHSLDSSVVSNLNGNILTLSQSGSADIFLTIDTQGRVVKHPLVNLVLDESYETKGMYFRVEFSGTPIAELILSVVGNGSIYTPDTGADSDGLIIEETSSRYTTRHTFNGASTNDTKGIEIYKKVSPFDKPEIDDIFSRSNALAGVEQFTGNEGLGWKGMNKMLLSFTSGDAVGEASKFFASYLMINLGDPVVHIDPKKVIKNNLDRTIGKTILMETRGVITGYKVFDVNNDEWEDIVVFYNDGHIQLIMNMSGKWRDMGYIAYVSDVKDGLKGVGDFSGDGYEDIVITDQKGKLILLDNQEGRFTRKNITYNENGVTHTLSGRLIQLEVFNMDNDKNGIHDIDDLVVMNEEGEIDILYGLTNSGTKTSKDFTKKLIEENLGISLDTNVRHDGGAVYFNELVIPESYKNTNTTTSGTGLDTITDGAILSHVYYERSVDYYSDANLSDYSYLASDVKTTDGNGNPVDIGSDIGNLLSGIPDYARGTQAGDGTLSSVSGDSNENPENRIYIRSEFSESANILVSKRFEPVGDTNSLKSDDIVKMVVTIENKGSTNATNLEYLDDIPDNFVLNQEKPYTLLFNNTGSEIGGIGSDIAIDDPYFDLAVPIGGIPAGSKVTLTYYVNVLPFVFGKMIVGLLEKGEVGDDVWGDIAFDTKNRSECDRDILMWRSVANRDYEKGSKNFTDDTYSTLAPEIQDEMLRNSTDEDGNGVPDYVDAGSGNTASLLPYVNDAKNKFDTVKAQEAAISTISPLLTYNPTTGNASTSWPSGSDITQIEQSIDTLMRGISCGFGGGGCLNMPVNWAPLAPGSSLNVLGYPTGLMSSTTGYPLFSMFVGLQIPPPYATCIPIPYFMGSPIMETYVSGPACLPTPGAGGYIGATSPTNTLRIFVTPTLTMGAGVAVCFGGPAIQADATTPLWPLPPTAGCVVAAASLPFCKEDGSDGDAEGVSGVGTFTDTWNAGSQTSCDVVANPATSTEKQEIITQVNEYIRTGNKDNLQRLYVQNRNNASFLNQLSSRPLISMGNSSNGDVSVDLEIDPKAANIGDIVKIKNVRVPAFPEFIMDWVNRQVEEIINKLTILPTLYIILPDVSRMSLDGNLEGFTDKMSGFISGAKNSMSSFGDRFSNSLNGSNRKYNSIGGTAVGLRSAYEFMNKLPFIRIRTANIPINIPWIDGAQLDKEIAKLSSQIDAYKKEVDSKTKSWQGIGADNVRAGTSKFISSLEKNLRTLEDYKKFPEKLQKLLTWKQRYIEQIVCNIRTIEKMLGGWLKDNARRFKKWVEFIIIIKSILKGWQAIIDLFSGYQQSCAVCKNERYDLRTWKVRLLSMLIPKIPVIKFPRWPDIVLDLHNIRLGLDIVMPEFTIKPVPIILPNLPKLFLPDAPNALISIPAIPTLPALPNLPNLPDLPSLPRIELPNLPPPPKIPNLFGGIAGVLNILKLLIKVVCYMQNTPLVPEGYAGERIAQLTQRQGKNPLDFLNLDMASMADLQIPGMKEIRVSTYLNLELKTDFIAEAARQIVRPINEFGADMRGLLPKEVGTTVDMRNAVPKNIRLNYNSETLKKGDATLFGVIGEKDLEESGIDEFKKIFISEVNKIENPFVRKQFLDIYSEMIHPDMGDANNFVASLENEQKEKFQEIYDYLDSEQKEVQNFENELNRLIKNYGNSELLSHFAPSTSIQMAESSRNTNAINPYIEKIHARSAGLFDSFNQEKKDSYISGLETEGTILANKLRSMRLAANDGISNSSDYNPMKSGDTSVPTSVYQGVYAIDTGGNRVWLFDYFDELKGNEEIIRVDYDNDGDRDYLYMNGNGIFLKENHEFSPHKNNDTSIQEVGSISLEDELLSPAPNYFHEAITTPNSINVTFAPIRKELDDYFRLEYYNRIYEFDLNTSTSQHSSSGRHVVDLIPAVLQIDGDKEFLSGAIVTKNRTYVDNMIGDVLVYGPKLIKKSSNDSAFGVSVGRDIYVGNASATISYRNKNTDNWNEIILPKNIRIRFQSAMEIRVESGLLYINNGTTSDTPISIYEYEKGFPILPDMKIIPAPGTNARIDVHANGVIESIFGGQDYRMINLGTKSSYYSVAFDEENAWYHARMSTIYPEGRTSNVALTLMSPQFQADNEPPFFDMDRTLYVPVYTNKTLELLDLIQDTSGLSEVQIDIDISSDANGNGIVDDDFVSLSDPSLSSIPLSLVSNSDFVVKLGTFETLGIHQVRLRAVDNNNNSSEMNVSIIVYAPIPTIEGTQNNTLSGYLDETVYGEPVDIVRVRDGNTSIVKPTNPQKYDAVISLTGGFFTGSYNSHIQTSSGQVSIKDGQNEAGIVREDTGKIQTSRPIDVIPATVDTPMQIKMDNVYYQNIILNPKTTKFYSTSDFSRVSDDGVYIKMVNPAYTYIQNPLTSLLLPGGISILSGNEFLFGIATDGNIYTNATNISFEYTSFGNYIIIKAKQNTDTIAEIFYKIQGIFVAR